MITDTVTVQPRSSTVVHGTPPGLAAVTASAAAAASAASTAAAPAVSAAPAAAPTSAGRLLPPLFRVEGCSFLHQLCPALLRLPGRQRRLFGQRPPGILAEESVDEIAHHFREVDHCLLQLQNPAGRLPVFTQRLNKLND
jgi:hypothetical protein